MDVRHKRILSHFTSFSHKNNANKQSRNSCETVKTFQTIKLFLVSSNIHAETRHEYANLFQT